MPIKQSNKGIDTRGYIVKKNIHVGILGKEEEDGGSQFTYALWKLVKPKLEKLGFKIKETIIDEPNYDKEIEKCNCTLGIYIKQSLTSQRKLCATYCYKVK